MIIDSHVHFGNSSDWGDFSPEYLMSIIEDVDYAICSNLNRTGGFPFSLRRGRS